MAALCGHGLVRWLVLLLRDENINFNEAMVLKGLLGGVCGWCAAVMCQKRVANVPRACCARVYVMRAAGLARSRLPSMLMRLRGG